MGDYNKNFLVNSELQVYTKITNFAKKIISNINSY